MSPTVSATVISSDQALRVARTDAEAVYRDLSKFRAVVALEADGWHVDYELKDHTRNGGAPHYIIDATTGGISWKRYEQ